MAEVKADGVYLGLFCNCSDQLEEVGNMEELYELSSYDLYKERNDFPLGIQCRLVYSAFLRPTLLRVHCVAWDNRACGTFHSSLPVVVAVAVFLNSYMLDFVDYSKVVDMALRLVVKINYLYPFHLHRNSVSYDRSSCLSRY